MSELGASFVVATEIHWSNAPAYFVEIVEYASEIFWSISKTEKLVLVGSARVERGRLRSKTELRRLFDSFMLVVSIMKISGVLQMKSMIKKCRRYYGKASLCL